MSLIVTNHGYSFAVCGRSDALLLRQSLGFEADLGALRTSYSLDGREGELSKVDGTLTGDAFSAGAAKKLQKIAAPQIWK